MQIRYEKAELFHWMPIMRSIKNMNIDHELMAFPFVLVN